MWDQRGHHSSAGRRNRKGQFPAGRPLLPPLPEGHVSAMCPSSPSGGIHFWVLASSIRGTPVSLTSRVTFSPRHMSCSVTSGWRLSVKMWSCLCLLTLLMVLPKEHCFGVKQEMMCADRGDTDRAWLCSMRWPWHDGKCPIKTGHAVHYQRGGQQIRGRMPKKWCICTCEYVFLTPQTKGVKKATRRYSHFSTHTSDISHKRNTLQKYGPHHTL